MARDRAHADGRTAVIAAAAQSRPRLQPLGLPPGVDERALHGGDREPVDAAASVVDAPDAVAGHPVPTPRHSVQAATVTCTGPGGGCEQLPERQGGRVAGHVASARAHGCGDPGLPAVRPAGRGRVDAPGPPGRAGRRPPRPAGWLGLICGGSARWRQVVQPVRRRRRPPEGPARDRRQRVLARLTAVDRRGPSDQGRRRFEVRRTSRGARGWACAGRSSGSRAPGRPPW